MMKKKYILIILSICGISLKAQVANNNFENWGTLTNNFAVTALGFNICGNFTYNEPLSWSSTNQLTGAADIGATELVTESSNAQDGLSSIRIESKTIAITPRSGGCNGTIVTNFSNVAPGLIVSGEFNIDEQDLIDQLLGGAGLQSLNPFTYPGVGHAVDFIPKNIQGFYRYTGVAGDSALIFSGVMKDGVVIAHVIQRLGNAANWTPFQLDFAYTSCEIPDTIITVITSSNLDVSFDPLTQEYSLNSDYTGVNGSVLFIDNVSMDTLQLNEFPPLAQNDASATLVNEVVTLNVLLNDEFCGAAAQSPEILISGSNGVVVVLANDDIEYTPNTGFSGLDTVTYYVCNDALLCDTALWVITVSSAPICSAVADFRSLPFDGTSIFNPNLNDVNCGGLPSITVLPVNGVANVESNGFISYSPVTGFVGQDSLTYTICSPANPIQCSSAKIYYEVVSAITELPATMFSISPNPAQSYLQIRLENKLTTYLKVFNMLGSEVLSTSFDQDILIDLAAFPIGVYSLHFENKLGRNIQKVILTK